METSNENDTANTTGLNLGIDAYATNKHSSADLLKNLEGRNVLRFAEGTEEHAGTALMAVELVDGRTLGVQVSMETDTSKIGVYADIRREGGRWVAEPVTERRELSQIEEPCPDCEIVEVVQKDIMDPENAQVLAVLNPRSTEPFAIDIHMDGKTGKTEFFDLD